MLCHSSPCYHCLFTSNGDWTMVLSAQRTIITSFIDYKNVIIKTCSNGPISLHSNIYFFNVGPPKQDIFLTTFYGIYFSHHYTYFKLQSFICWTSVASFHVLFPPYMRVNCSIYMVPWYLNWNKLIPTLSNLEWDLNLGPKACHISVERYFTAPQIAWPLWPDCCKTFLHNNT